MIKFIPRQTDNPDTSYDVAVDNGGHFAELYQEVDGFYVLDLSMSLGFLESWALRALADKLDELNAAWKDTIDQYFKTQEEESLTQFMQELDRL